MVRLVKKLLPKMLEIMTGINCPTFNPLPTTPMPMTSPTQNDATFWSQMKKSTVAIWIPGIWIMKKCTTRQVYNLLLDLWNWFIVLGGVSLCKVPLMPKLCRQFHCWLCMYVCTESAVQQEKRNCGTTGAAMNCNKTGHLDLSAIQIGIPILNSHCRLFRLPFE